MYSDAMETKLTLRNLFIGTLCIVAIMVLTIFLTRMNKKQVAVPSTNGTTTTAVQTASTTVVVTTPNGSYTIEQLPDTKPKMPVIVRALPFTGTFTADQKAAIQATANVLEKKLEQNPADSASWLSLGAVRKIAGDYTGAQMVWEYVAALAPNNTASLSNLADLNANFLKNYSVAARYYKKVITLDPTDTGAYRDLFTLYTTSYTTGANSPDSILKQGIAANPNAVDLEVLLARYYKQIGRVADAKSEYAAAIANANAQGNTKLSASIQQEAQF